MTTISFKEFSQGKPVSVVGNESQAQQMEQESGQPSLMSKLGERAKTFGKEALTLGTLGANTLDQNVIPENRGLEAVAGGLRAAQAPIKMTGAIGGAIGDVVGAGLEATGLAEPLGKALAPVVQSDPVQKAMEVYKSLPQDTQEVLGAIMNTANIPLAGGGVSVAKTLGEKAGQVAKQSLNIKSSTLKGLDEMAEKSLKKDIGGLLTSTKGISNKAKLAEQKGVNLNEILADPQIYRGIKVENSKILPDEAIDVVDERIGQLMDAKQKLLPEIDRLVPKQSKEVIRQKAYADIKGKFTPADELDIKKSIDNQIDALPDELSPSEIDAFRARARASARDAKGLQKRSSEYSALENASRDTVFDITDNLPVANAQDFKAINDYVKQMIETKGFLDKTLRNQVVKGGRLRNYAMRTVGAVAGVKGGALGAIAGSEIGGLIADIITNNQFGSSIKMNLIRNLTDDPAILKQADELLKSVQELNPSKSLQNTANSTIKTSSISPQSTTPLPKGKGIGGFVNPDELLPKKKTTNEVLRQGQPPVSQNDIQTFDLVARERFDIPNLKKISFGGSDRDVYDLGNGKVIKITKTSRGLSQQSSSQDWYAESQGLIPKTYEAGDNYLVKEKINPPDSKTKKMVAELKKLNLGNPKYNSDYYDNVQKAVEIMDNAGYNGSGVLDYGDVLWGDFQAIRNWGTTLDGNPMLLDEGSLNGKFVAEHQSLPKGTTNLNNPEFRKIYVKSREAKKKFGDTDSKTMYGGIGATGVEAYENNKK